MTFFERLCRHNAPFVAKALRRLADEAEALYPGPPAWVYPILFTTTKGEHHMADLTVRDTEPDLTARVQFTDEHGHPTTPDDTPEWESSDETVATVQAGDDGVSATVSIADTPGATVISVSSTDTDGTLVTAQGTLTVIAGEAAVSEVTFERSGGA